MKCYLSQNQIWGSPETENLEIQTDEQPKNEEQEVKQDVKKESTK